MDTLRRGGIEPLGAELIDNSVWVHAREVDPSGVESLSVLIGPNDTAHIDADYALKGSAAAVLPALLL